MDDEFEDDKQFLSTKLNPILKPLVTELMKTQPKDVIPFIRNWIATQGSRIESGSPSQRFVRPEGFESSSEEDDEGDDYFDEDIHFDKKVNAMAKQHSRISVSAEVYGEFNKKAEFKPPVYPKSQEQMNAILNKLNASILFSGLIQKEREVIALAMRVVEFEEGTKVIEQGADGHELFVVMSGKLDCFKKFSPDEADKFLVTYGPGGAFGELALMYNAPRAATIIAKEDCVLASLDRESFNKIVKEAVIRRRENFMDFINRIELFKNLSVQEKEKICDCLFTSVHQKGERIIQQGDKGDKFYLIQDGECHAAILDKESGVENIVYRFQKNDYFGELAILKDEPRAASIIADTELTLGSFDRASFKRLLGPLEEILKRNASRYNNPSLEK